MGAAFNTDQDVPIKIPGPPLVPHMGFAILLEASPSGEATPVLTGLSVKATPAPRRVRLFRYPLSVFDRERDRYGNTRGYEGAAFERLSALEALEETSAPVQVIDNRTGEAYVGQVDLVEFTSAAPPDRNESAFGGVS